jgi:UDP-N-acetylmuramoyl-L-alanyl-D-glutamate--2,6-diaminopimelate ligase
MTTRILQHYHEACGRLAIDRPDTLDVSVTGLTNDSRRVQRGDLFVAINGALDDGRRYIADAVARGAAGVVYSADAMIDVSVPAWRVTDDYMALGRMAEFHFGRPATRMRFTGITGTNGKTTTAFLLRDILRHAGRCTGMIGTVQYEIGDQKRVADRTTPTPIELQALLAEMADAQVDTVVMEVSSHALEQRRMGTLLFDTAAFTNLSGDHLDYHGDMDEYFDTKKRLFTECMTASGTPIVNIDDSWGRRLADELPNAVTFGSAESAACRVIEHTSTIHGSDVTYAWQGQPQTVHSPLIGNFNVSNVMAATASALALEISPENIAAALENFDGVPGRMQTVGGRDGVSVIIDYAHTDAALDNVLSTVKPLCRGRLIVVFGCGGDRDRTKRPRMAEAAAQWGDLVIVSSDNPRTEDPDAIIADILTGLSDCSYEKISDRSDAIARAVELAGEDDTIVIAGKGHEDYQEINGEKLPFSDLEEAQRALNFVA